MRNVCVCVESIEGVRKGFAVWGGWVCVGLFWRRFASVPSGANLSTIGGGADVIQGAKCYRFLP